MAEEIEMQFLERAIRLAREGRLDGKGGRCGCVVV